MAKKPKIEAFKPYVGRRKSSALFPICIVAARTFMGCLVVYERPAMSELGPLGVGVCCMDWHDNRLPDGPYADITREENITLQDALKRIKKQMLEHGAQAEAVRLIGEISPFDEKELTIMAEKLTKKAPAKKTSTKAADAGEKKTSGRKGNPEALKKAQEAAAGKRAEMRAKKIKALKKPKDIAAREGTFRHQMLTDLLGAKTVGDFYDMNEKYDAGCIRFAEKDEYISLG